MNDSVTALWVILAFVIGLVIGQFGAYVSTEQDLKYLGKTRMFGITYECLTLEDSK